MLLKHDKNKKAWEALKIYFSNKFWFKQNLYCCRPGLISWETKMSVAGLISFSLKTRKATGFMHLQVNCQEINQATRKCQMDFLSNGFLLHKEKKMNMTTELTLV